MVESMHNGMYWDVSGNDNGAKVQLWPKHGGKNQRFRIDIVGNGLVRFVAKHTGKVIDCPGPFKDGGIIHYWQYHGGSNQLWRILKPML